jgi:ABC-type sugar transport system permease subunit
MGDYSAAHRGAAPGLLYWLARRFMPRFLLQGSDTTWAVAFLVPYIGVFLFFVLYPVGYGLYLGHRPVKYLELFHDPIYVKTVVNTLI